MTDHDHTSIAKRPTDARIKEVSRMSKAQLAQMHVDNGGLMGYRHYLTWSHDELVNSVLIDEAVNSNA